MALDNYANFVRGALSASVDNSQTTFPVNDATIFPDPANGGYNLVVWDVGSHPRPDQDPDVEVVRVTARDTGTDELTVTRGQEATTGVSHPSGSALHLSYTAKLAADIETDYVAEGENFDGQSTSQFTNLASVDTDEVTLAGRKYERLAGPTDIAGSSLTVQTNFNYKEVLVFFRADGNDNPSEIHLRANGDSGTNYDYRYFENGTIKATSGADHILVGDIEGFHDTSGKIRIMDRVSNRTSPMVTADISALLNQRVLQSGIRTSFEGLDQFTLSNANGSAANFEVSVFGIPK